MSAQRGRDLLLKIDAESNGTFVTVAGLRARVIAINTQTVDVTNSESSGQWRELLSAAGARSAKVTGSGIFKDAASDEAVRANVFSGAIRNWQIVIPAFGTIAGAFQITAYEFAGRHDTEVTFDITLESAGELTFAAAP